MALRFVLVAIGVMALASSFANASDPSPLQDVCVAIDDPRHRDALFVNGRFCKNPNAVNPTDFLFRGLNIPGNTSNPLGFNVTLVNVDRLPGLNTLGVSVARIDFAPNGLNPPHIHPRATEVFTVMNGTILVGFVLSNPPPGMRNRLFNVTLTGGDVYVFPQGLPHFQLNIGTTNAVAMSGFSSQNPGVITIANAVFGSNPPINQSVLAKAFQVNNSVIASLQSQFGITS